MAVTAPTRTTPTFDPPGHGQWRLETSHSGGTIRGVAAGPPPSRLPHPPARRAGCGRRPAVAGRSPAGERGPAPALVAAALALQDEPLPDLDDHGVADHVERAAAFARDGARCHSEVIGVALVAGSRFVGAAIEWGLPPGELLTLTQGLSPMSAETRRWLVPIAAAVRESGAEIGSLDDVRRLGPDVAAGYRAILRFNEPFKAPCTSWQLPELEPPVVNDHSDPAYDAAAVARLVDMHAEAAPVVDALAGALQRYAPYRPRFDTALARIRSGGLEWFTKP